MNPEKTILPDFLIADLYKQTLVIIEGGEAVAEPEQPPVTAKTVREKKDRQWFLGSNLRKITLVVSEKEAVFLQDGSLQFLSSILGACKLNLGDVAIVNFHNDPVIYTAIKEQLGPEYLVLFGVTAQQIRLPFAIPHYQVQSYDHCQLLMAPALDTMLGNTQEARLEKSKLWLCLKKMFNI